MSAPIQALVLDIKMQKMQCKLANIVKEHTINKCIQSEKQEKTGKKRKLQRPHPTNNTQIE